MAKQEIAFGLKIDGVEQTIKSVKDLKGAISAMQAEAETADIGSEQYKNAIENIEKLNDKLREVTQTEKQAAKATEDLANAEKEAAKETGDLRKQFEVLEDELFMLAGQGKQNSAEFKKLTIEAANLNKKIDDVNQSLSGGGTERAEAGFGKLSESLGKLDFKGVAQGAKMMGTALAATGVMLIVKAISYLIENFDELSSGSSALSKMLKMVGDYIGKLIDNVMTAVTFITDLIGVTSKSERAMEAQGEAIVKSANKTKAALEEQVKGFDNQIAAAKAAGKSTVELEKAKQDAIIATNDKIQEQLIAFVRSGGKLNEEQKKLFTESVAAEKAAIQEKKIVTITADKEASDKAKERAAERAAANLAAIKIIEDAQIAAIKDEELRLFAAEVKANERRLKEIKDGKESAELKRQELEAQAILFEQNIAKINSDAAAKRKAEEDKIAADRLALNQQMLDQKHAQQIAQDEIDGAAMVAKAEKEKALEKAKQDEIVKIVQDSLTAAQNLSDIFFLFKKSKAEKGSKQELELAKKQFNVNKALQLGMATIDGFKAITSFLSTNPLTVLGVPNPGAIAGLIAVSTTTAATIAKIAASKFEGGGGGAPSAGGGGGGAPSIPPPPTIATPENNTNKTTSFDETGKNLNFQGTPTPTINVKASVGVDEITSKSNRVEVLENQSTF